MLAARPDLAGTLIALLYCVGAHGIMTLNDFKALEGDRATGVALAAGHARRPSARPGSPPG